MLRKILYLVWCIGLIGATPAVSQAASVGGAAGSSSTVTITSLQPSVPSGQPVGTTITWTTIASGAGPFEYRFSVQMGGRASLIVQDFSPSNSFAWTPIIEGSYTIQTTVQVVGTTGQAVSFSSQPYTINSRIVNNQPMVTPTSNPLVAFYSAPPCSAGTATVEFGPATNTSNWDHTQIVNCMPGMSLNFYIAGMRARTTYAIRTAVDSGGRVTYSPVSFFRTGPLNVSIPPITVPVSASSATSVLDDVVFFDGAGVLPPNGAIPRMFATDLSGNVIWYYQNNLDPTNQYVSRPLPGGDVIAQFGDSLGPNQILEIMDPAGHPIQVTNEGRINEQLAAMGAQTVDGLHHEANVLPNGHIVVLGYVERMYNNVQGSTGPVDILSDEIIDMNSNLQVDWTWNAFDHLDINRPATLGETCTDGQAGCPPDGLQLAPIANDWTHSNAIIYSKSDHNLLLSIRHQDWIIKIDYQDAKGPGDIIWRLGKDGDFTINDPSNNPWPWFSHQHGIQNWGNDMLTTFDDGNTRCASEPAPCDSRGQVYQLNEQTKVANLVVNSDLGNYSFALGWAQVLANGDYSFTSGAQNYPNAFGQDIEVTPNGLTKTFVAQSQGLLYRAYRMPNMYSGCCGD